MADGNRGEILVGEDAVKCLVTVLYVKVEAQNSSIQSPRCFRCHDSRVARIPRRLQITGLDVSKNMIYDRAQALSATRFRPESSQPESNSGGISVVFGDIGGQRDRFGSVFLAQPNYSNSFWCNILCDFGQNGNGMYWVVSWWHCPMRSWHRPKEHPIWFHYVPNAKA